MFASRSSEHWSSLDYAKSARNCAEFHRTAASPAHNHDFRKLSKQMNEAFAVTFTAVNKQHSHDFLDVAVWKWDHWRPLDNQLNLAAGEVVVGQQIVWVTYPHRQSIPRGTPRIRVEYGWRRCSQQKTCNISETGQDRTNLLLKTNRKLHTRFWLVPKSMTLDDFERLLHKTCVFGSLQRKFEWR